MEETPEVLVAQNRMSRLPLATTESNIFLNDTNLFLMWIKGSWSMIVVEERDGSDGVPTPE
jgi:hypothetical protein